MYKPKKSHLDVAFRIVKYVKVQHGVDVFMFVVSSLKLSVFYGSDWAGCSAIRRYVSGFYVKLRESLILWKVKKTKYRL